MEIKTINGQSYGLIKLKTEQEKAQYLKEHQEQWVSEGKTISKMRGLLKVTKRKLAKLAGICVPTLTRLEKGKQVRRRNAVYHSCMNALQNLYLKLQNQMQGAFEE